jgi:signal transduction histidine kinase/ActR/RegA family two-component response regulator
MPISVIAVPLRRRLFLLAAAGILPLALMAGIGLYVLAQQQRTQVERVGLELARAMASAVDGELQSSISVLESLATTVTLDRNDLPGFYERARRILGTQPDWAAIMLADPSGTRLADTRYGYGIALPPIVERASFDRVLRTRAPAIGNLAKNPHGVLLFPVRVPVIRQGELRYVLTAIVKPEDIRDVVTRQQVADDWVISIFDANGLRVARSRAHDENLGGRASPSLQKLMAGGAPQGFGVTYALEGERIYSPYSRLPDSGWSAALGIPAPLIEAAAYRSLAVYGGGILLSIALGTFAALWVARTINQPIGALRSAAQALGRGEALEPPDTSIQEIRDVAGALVAAAGERARGEAQREELLRKERLARETAEAADRAKDEFLAVLSHELRTPLNAVYGWARMLQAGQIDGEETARAFDAIVRNANVQVQLIDDLLDVSRIATGKLRLDVRSVDLATVIEGALDAVRPAAAAKAIRIQSVLDPRAGPVTGDPARLQQVVWNLLINAVKFTPKGGRVQVHLQRVNSHVEIVVSDTGQGIAPEMLPFVFDRFRQSDSSSTRAHGGLGLGLSLVKHLVELHGGTVAAQSSGNGMGATFVVKLPLPIADISAGPIPRAHPNASTIESITAPGVRLDGTRVLVVDDDPDALALAQAILAGAGATTRTCLSATDALDVLRQWRPDVLVSDIEMPGEDGYSLIRKVRALDRQEGGNTPAVALTAYGRTQDRIRSLAAGYNMHVPKPVDPGELTTIVASVTRAGGGQLTGQR